MTAPAHLAEIGGAIAAPEEGIIESGAGGGGVGTNSSMGNITEPGFGLPVDWEARRARFLFVKRRELSPDGIVLSASQQFGVVPQSFLEGQRDARVMAPLKGTDGFQRVVRNDFVISLRSFEGGIELSRQDGIISPAYSVMRPAKEVHPDYFRYALKEDRFVQRLRGVTTGIRDGKTIRYEDFAALRLPVPPLDEQRAIAAFLDRETARIDALIAKKRRLIDLLAEQRTALITHAVTKGLNPAAPMKPSGIDWLGNVPGHWEVKRLRHLVSGPLQYGANEAAELDDPALPRFVRITDVDESGRLRDETFKSLPEDVARPFLLRDGDLLLARSGATVGKAFYYDLSWGRCCYAGYLIRARLHPARMVAKFAHHCTQSNGYWQWVASSFIQATIQNVSAEKYANLWIGVPPLHEQLAIVAHLDAACARFDALTAAAEAAIARLTEYRQALISAAVTGKIDVRERCEGGA